MWEIDAMLMIGVVDFCLFTLLLAGYRRLAGRIGHEIAVIAENPTAMEALGRGLAQSMRASAKGEDGKETQVTKNEQKKLFAMVLKHQMDKNLPALKFAMDFMGPEAWRYIEDNPQIGLVALNKFGPQLNRAAEGIMGKMGQMQGEGGGGPI